MPAVFIVLSHFCATILLRPGADIAAFKLEDVDAMLEDSIGQLRHCTRRLVTQAVWLGLGRIVPLYYRSITHTPDALREYAPLVLKRQYDRTPGLARRRFLPRHRRVGMAEPRGGGLGGSLRA